MEINAVALQRELSVAV